MEAVTTIDNVLWKYKHDYNENFDHTIGWIQYISIMRIIKNIIRHVNWDWHLYLLDFKKSKGISNFFVKNRTRTYYIHQIIIMDPMSSVSHVVGISWNITPHIFFKCN